LLMSVSLRFLQRVAVLLLLPLAPLSAQVVVSGTVTDSLTGKRLAGALVQVADSATRAHSAYTDSTGTYRIEGVSPGKHIAGFFHPALPSLGITLSPLRLELG